MTITRKAQDLIRFKCRKCSLTYGVAPCTASGASGTECRNTRKTCQDLPNYTETTQNIDFVEASEAIPDTGNIIFPTLNEKGVSYKENEINPGALSRKVSALGKTGDITISLMDHIHHDRGIDPYYSTRPTEPQGTYWVRWLARNYYQGMTIERYRVIDGVVSTDKQTFYVKDISYSNGNVSVRAEDIIKKLSETLIPAVSTGILASDITDSQTIFTVTGGSYEASGSIVINDETMTYTRVGETFTVVRGANAKSHSQNDNVQQALVYTDQRVDDVAYDLTVNQAGADSSLVTFADWQDEITAFLPAVRLTRTIGEPTEFGKLLAELQEQTLVSEFFDQDSQKIRLVAYKPGITVKQINDDSNITSAGVPTQRDDDARINVVTVHYGKTDPLEDDKPKNYARTQKIIAPAETIARYDGAIKERQVFANWLAADQQSQAYYLGSLMLIEGEEERTTVGFELEYKDNDLDITDIVAITTRDLVDASGAPIEKTAIVISKKEVEVGSRWQYKAILSAYANLRFGYIAPTNIDEEYAGEWTYDLLNDTLTNIDLMDGSDSFDLNYAPFYNFWWVTEEQKDKYVWLSDGTNNFDDGREPYQLV